MAVSIDRAAYATEYEIFDRALASERGILVYRESEAKCFDLRFRLNKARQLDRELNRRIYRDDPLHPMYGRSEYSAIVIRIEYNVAGDRWYCRLEKAIIEDVEIEDIPPPGTEEEPDEMDQTAD